MKAWIWVEEAIATGYGGGRWHTWDEHGIGGETNAGSGTLNDAKRDCLAAIVCQGWAPGGWRVQW